jgi:hypothetical protein
MYIQSLHRSSDVHAFHVDRESTLPFADTFSFWRFFVLYQVTTITYFLKTLRQLSSIFGKCIV